jgi:hypothetical protein
MEFFFEKLCGWFYLKITHILQEGKGELFELVRGGGLKSTVDFLQKLDFEFVDTVPVHRRQWLPNQSITVYL